MKLLVDGIQFNILLDESKLNQNKIPIIFLHGFTGRASNWKFIFNELPQKFFPIAIDLIGHGETDSPIIQNLYTCRAIVNQIDSIVTQLNINRFIVAGYSMGGRAALSYCLKHTEKIFASIFESTTAGIEDFSEIKDRVEFDLLLSDKIKNDGINSFLEFWFDTPLFANLKSLPNYKEFRTERLQNNITGLSNLLLGFSTGLMPSYWDRLISLKFPVLLLTGNFDNKYTQLNQRMQSKFPNALHKIVNECCHSVHLEKPELFTKLVRDFLNSI